MCESVLRQGIIGIALAQSDLFGPNAGEWIEQACARVTHRQVVCVVVDVFGSFLDRQIFPRAQAGLDGFLQKELFSGGLFLLALAFRHLRSFSSHLKGASLARPGHHEIAGAFFSKGLAFRVCNAISNDNFRSAGYLIGKKPKCFSENVVTLLVVLIPCKDIRKGLVCQ